MPVPSPTKYKQDADGNAQRTLPTGVTSRGVMRLDGVLQSVDALAFGVRVNWQEISVSDDWDYMAGLGGSGSGGDGGNGMPCCTKVSRLASSSRLASLR